MRFKKYIKAFRIQMLDVEDVESSKYDQLLIQHDGTGINISSVLEKTSYKL